LILWLEFKLDLLLSLYPSLQTSLSNYQNIVELKHIGLIIANAQF